MTELAAPPGQTTTLPPPSANGSTPSPPAPQGPERGRLRTRISGMRNSLIAGAVCLIVVMNEQRHRHLPRHGRAT